MKTVIAALAKDDISSLVLRALELRLMIHGGGNAVTGRSQSGIVYDTPVFSVMVSATTKTKIVVYAAATHESHEEALRIALTNAISRSESKVEEIRGKRT